MAHTYFKVTPLITGERHVIVQVTFALEGAKNLANKVIVEPRDFDFIGNRQPFTIDQVWFGLAGVHAEIGFDTVGEDEDRWVLAEGASGHYDFRSFGGLSNKELGGNGNLVLSTIGTSDDPETFGRGSLILNIRGRKYNKPDNPQRRI